MTDISATGPKELKMYLDAEKQNAGKQDRDDGIKHFGKQSDPTYLSTLKTYRLGLYSELLNAILFPCFLLFCYPYMLVHF